MGVVFASIFGQDVSPQGRFIVIIVWAFGTALSSAFLGGYAAAKGSIPFPFVREHPVQFTVGGGIAVLLITALLDYYLYVQPAQPDHSKPNTSALHFPPNPGLATYQATRSGPFGIGLIELSTRHNFVYWLAIGATLRGWARSASGDTVEGIPWIEHGIRGSRATGPLDLPYYPGSRSRSRYDRCVVASVFLRRYDSGVSRLSKGDFTPRNRSDREVRAA
jgi:hypothetical protein